MPERYFNPWRDALERECRTCRHSIGTRDGWHLWCAQHRIVVVFACGLWERAPGAEVAGREAVSAPPAARQEEPGRREPDWVRKFMP